MLKREYFPLELVDFGGKPFQNQPIIPPFHAHIVKEGIDLDLALSVIDEAVEGTLEDLKGCTTRLDVPQMHLNGEGKVNYGHLMRDERRIYFPQFPLTKGLHIQKRRISPFGGDSYVMVDKRPNLKSYFVPKDVPMSDELLAEYQMTREGSGKYFRIECPAHWSSHNVDFRDVFYKNLILALNNAVVRRIRVERV